MLDTGHVYEISPACWRLVYTHSMSRVLSEGCHVDTALSDQHIYHLFAIHMMYFIAKCNHTARTMICIPVSVGRNPSASDTMPHDADNVRKLCMSIVGSLASGILLLLMW